MAAPAAPADVTQVEVGGVESEVRDVEQLKKRLETALNKNKKLNRLRNEQLTEQKKKAASAEKRLKVANEELQVYTDQASALTSENTARVDKVEAQIKKLGNDIEAAKIGKLPFRKMEKNLGELQDDLALIQSTGAAGEAVCKERIKKVTIQVTAAENQRDRANESVRKLGEDVARLEREKYEITNEKTKVEKTLSQLHDGIADHLDKLDEHNSNLAKQIEKLSEPDNDIAPEVGFGRAWGTYKRINTRGYVRNTVSAFGKSLISAPK